MHGENKGGQKQECSRCFINYGQVIVMTLENWNRLYIPIPLDIDKDMDHPLSNNIPCPYFKVVNESTIDDESISSSLLLYTRDPIENVYARPCTYRLFDKERDLPGFDSLSGLCAYVAILYPSLDYLDFSFENHVMMNYSSLFLKIIMIQWILIYISCILHFLIHEFIKKCNDSVDSIHTHLHTSAHHHEYYDDIFKHVILIVDHIIKHK